ncbi:MAG: B12-binding domain-containing radical SAM protein [Candidatus Omnitrophica bacterium]|nr:B12-binding domain-containing radical SAM protein [Candidatus Omnitrophota bacterium]
MKVAFVNNSNESLGVEYLSAYLKQHGHCAQVFVDPQLFNDENIRAEFLHRFFDYKKNLARDILAYSPDIIGFSVVSDFYPWACLLAEEIKRNCNIPVIFGGIHPTTMPQEVINNSFVDMICIGEGEQALLEVVEKLQAGGWPDEVANIWVKSSGKIKRNGIRPLIKNLDSLPFPDKILFSEAGPHYDIGYFTMASRGCLYRCSYCHNSYLGKLYKEYDYYRYRSVENLISELEGGFSKKKHRIIRFSDDIFPFEKQWLSEFSLKYPKRIGAPFICYIHPQTTDEETISLLKKSGCCEVQIGVQTLYERTQKAVLNRDIKQERWEDLISQIKKCGMAITAENIIGIPGQSENEVKDMVRFYTRNRVNRVHIFWLRYYPKTDISNRFKEHDSEHTQRPFTMGGDVFKKEMVKLRILFSLAQLFPMTVIDFFLKKRVYYFMPVWPLFLINIFSNITSGTYSDKITRRREKTKYLYYIRKRLWQKN